MEINPGDILVGLAALLGAVLAAVQWRRSRTDTRQQQAAADRIAETQQVITAQQMQLSWFAGEVDRLRAEASARRAAHEEDRLRWVRVAAAQDERIEGLRALVAKQIIDAANDTTSPTTDPTTK